MSHSRRQHPLVTIGSFRSRLRDAGPAAAESRNSAALSWSSSALRVGLIAPFLSVACSDSQISKLTPKPPKVSIESPSATGRFYSDVEIAFSGTVQDNQDDLTTLQTTLVSDALGELGSYFPSEDGLVTDQLVLPEGAHTLTFEAVDDQGDVGRDTVAITVGAANSVPTCQITTPEDGDAESPGEAVSFRGSVSDADLLATELVVEWSSDVQGVLSSTVPDSTGITGFQTDSLDAFTHVITLKVTDEVGAQCSDSILFTVGAPPVVMVTSPDDDSVFSEAESITFRATVEDGEDDADELALSWTSDVDGELNTDPALGDGSVIFNTTGLSVGQHIVRLTATDTDGFYSQSAVVVAVNGLPTAPNVAIAPDPADTTDSIRAVISTPSSDPDGDAVTYTYQWYSRPGSG
jgi:hypothetical protein